MRVVEASGATAQRVGNLQESTSDGDTSNGGVDCSNHGGGDAACSQLFTLYTLLLSERDVSTKERRQQIACADRRRQDEIDHEKQAKIDCANAERRGAGFFGDVGMLFKHAAADVASMHIGRLSQDVRDTVLRDPQFWKDLEAGAQEIGKWAAVAGSVVLAGVTCGAGSVAAGLVIAAAVMSVAGAAQSDFHLLEKMNVDERTAGWIGVGLSIGGAIGSGVGAVAAAGASLSAASSVQGTLRTVGTVANAGASTSTAVGGAAHVVVSKFDEQAQLALVEERMAQLNIDRVDAGVTRIIHAMEQSCATSTMRLSALREAEQNNANALMSIARVRG